MSRHRAQPAPIRPRGDVARAAALKSQATYHRGKGKLRPELVDQQIDRHVAVVATPVAPTENVDALAADVGEGWRRSHAASLEGIRQGLEQQE